MKLAPIRLLVCIILFIFVYFTVYEFTHKLVDKFSINFFFNLQFTELLLRNLDVLTNEETLLKEISNVSSIPIQSCQIARDSLTNLSRGICYLEMKNVLEAIKLYNALTATVLNIEGRKGIKYFIVHKILLLLLLYKRLFLLILSKSIIFKNFLNLFSFQ